MSLLSPALLLFGLLALPILALYMLKLRRREVTVSSTMLWQTLLRDRQANAPWQRIKRNLLLILQLLILAGMVLSLARPTLHVPTVAQGSLVILLDASASMSATDVTPNRFEAARSVARGLIDGLARASQVTLIQVAGQPHVLAAGESNPNVLHKALEQAEVSAEVGNWQTAFSLAAGAISTQPQGINTIVIISDGGIPNQGLPPLPAEVRYIPIGRSEKNLAISALALRPAGTANELFASVTNYDTQEHAAIISIYTDDILYTAQQVSIPPGKTKGISLSNFPAASKIVLAQLSPLSEEPANSLLDDFPLDDSAYAVNQASSNRRVLLLTPGNFFLDQLLGALPNLRSFRALPGLDENGNETDRYTLPEEPFNLYIFDQTLPTQGSLEIPALPLGNLLLINPPSNALFSVSGIFSPTVELRVRDHALTQFLDWSSVHVRQARKVQLPAWAEVLVDSPNGALVFAGETQGRRVAVLTFDLHDSDLPLQVAFPVLFANLINYLVPAQAVQGEGNLLPGSSVEIQPPPGTETVAIASPGGRIYTLTPTESGFFFADTHELGVYAVNFLTKETQSVDYFAVTPFDPGESTIKPATSIQIGRIAVPASDQSELGRLEIWPWLAGLALAVSLIEWWAYHRNMSFPGRGRLNTLLNRLSMLPRRLS